jgi:hypothetical protein
MAQKEDMSSVKRISRVRAIGFIVFALGIILAIIAGLVAGPSDIDTPQDTVSELVLILAIFGIVIGLLNITAQEVLLLMVAAVALIVVGEDSFIILDKISKGLGNTINDMLYYFGRLMAPAAIIAAVRALFAVGFPGSGNLKQ